MNASAARALTALCLLVLFGVAAARRPSISESRIALLEQLRSRDAVPREAARQQLIAERSRTIESLLELARSNEDEAYIQRSARQKAFELLGRYRAQEARQFLIDEIEYTWADVSPDDFNALLYYPAARALVEIGDAAGPELLMVRMGRPVTDRELKIHAYVIRLDCGEEVGLLRIQRTLEQCGKEREEYAKRRGIEFDVSIREKNLSRLIEIYKAIRPDDPRDWPRPAALSRSGMREPHHP